MTDNVSALQALPPGSTIGILGGGQLARMLAVAAARLGLYTHIYSDDSGPAFDVAPRASKGDYRDRAALAAFAGAVDVVTFEFENVPVEVAEQLQALVPVRPGAKALAVAQDRLAEKTFLSELALPLAPFAAITRAADIAAAMAEINGPAILKTRRLGYDGKGQAAVSPADDYGRAFSSVGEAPSVLEQRLRFEFEFSVLAVRGCDGEIGFYDSPVNSHAEGILRLSKVPSPLTEAEQMSARAITARIADALDYVGVLAVELFYLGAGAETPLIVNEIAPRVHNSGHWTVDACAISQFENHIRAVAGWPLGSTDRHSDAEMVNLIGADADDWVQLAAEPGVCLHLYGKRHVRPGRKMGHMTRLAPHRR